MKQISQSKVVGTEAAPAPLSLDLVLLPAVADEVEDEEEPEAFLCGGITLKEKQCCLKWFPQFEIRQKRLLKIFIVSTKSR